MSVMRVHKNENFTVMSNYHFKEKKMSLKAKGLLSLMLSLPDTWDYSVAGLTTLSKDGKDGVMSALSELESFGYLTRERMVNDKGQFCGIEYNIYEQPQPKKPISENQTSEKPISAIPISENPTQLNTYSIKDLSNKNINELNTDSGDSFAVLNNILDIELKELFLDYADMRKGIGFPLTERGMKMLIQRCDKISKGSPHIQKILLEAAIINSWKNVYPPNEREMEYINQARIDELKEYYGLNN